MNEDDKFSKHDEDTLQVLQSLLPSKRCGLDGRVPVNEVRLPCGHIYCDLCAKDIAATAALVGQVPACKVCGTHFQLPTKRAESITDDGGAFGLPTLDEVRTRNALPTGVADAFADPPVILPGSLGERAKNALIMGNKETLPWVAPSRRVKELNRDYTKSEQHHRDDDPFFGFSSAPTPAQTFADGRLSVSVPSPMTAQDVANEFGMLRYGQPSQQELFQQDWQQQAWQQQPWQPEMQTVALFNDGLEEFDFNEYFDFDAYGNDTNQYGTEPLAMQDQAQFQQSVDTTFSAAPTASNNHGISLKDALPGGQPAGEPVPYTQSQLPYRPSPFNEPLFTQQQPAIDPQVFGFHTGLTRPPSPVFMPRVAGSPKNTLLQPQPHRPAPLLNQTFRSPSPVSPQVTTPGHSYTQFRDMSVLAGDRICFKGDLRNQAAMEEAVKANGGNVTGGGFKHTKYGVIGSGWKPGPAWARNGIQVISEDEFWELLARRQRETVAEKTGS